MGQSASFASLMQKAWNTNEIISLIRNQPSHLDISVWSYTDMFISKNGGDLEDFRTNGNYYAVLNRLTGGMDKLIKSGECTARTDASGETFLRRVI